MRRLEDVDRAVTDGETEGFVKVHVRRGSDRIVGATIVARHAGEMISEVTLAIVAGVGLGRLLGRDPPLPDARPRRCATSPISTGAGA